MPTFRPLRMKGSLPTFRRWHLNGCEGSVAVACRRPLLADCSQWQRAAIGQKRTSISDRFRPILLKKAVPSRPTCLKPEKCSIDTLLCEICSSLVPAMIRIST